MARMSLRPMAVVQKRCRRMQNFGGGGGLRKPPHNVGRSRSEQRDLFRLRHGRRAHPGMSTQVARSQTVCLHLRVSTHTYTPGCFWHKFACAAVGWMALDRPIELAPDYEFVRLSNDAGVIVVENWVTGDFFELPPTEAPHIRLHRDVDGFAVFDLPGCGRRRCADHMAAQLTLNDGELCVHRSGKGGVTIERFNDLRMKYVVRYEGWGQAHDSFSVKTYIMDLDIEGLNVYWDATDLWNGLALDLNYRRGGGASLVPTHSGPVGKVGPVRCVLGRRASALPEGQDFVSRARQRARRGAPFARQCVEHRRHVVRLDLGCGEVATAGPQGSLRPLLA